MQQVIVRKQGRFDYSNWSSRVLTLDPLTGVLLLSKKSAPEQVDHHAMQPTHIEVWPHYDSKYIDEDFDSLQAKLTIRLAGRAYPDTASAGSKKKKHALVKVNSAGMATEEAWVLRFTSLTALCNALVSLERLTRLQSRETSDESFGASAKPEPCAQLPASARQLYGPIRQAWVQDQRKKQQKLQQGMVQAL